jgi:outer membrane protein
MKAIAVCTLAVAAALSTPVVAAAEDGPWMVRVRALYMDVRNGNSPDVDLEAENKLFPEFDISYFLTKNIAAELVLTYPQKHDIELGGTDIGSIKHLPPTLLLQYHFNPEGQFRPYVGAGINYTHFSSVDIDVPGVDIDRNSVGIALQIGADYKLENGWFLNADIKYVDINTKVTAGGNKLTDLKIDPMLYSIGIGYRF